MYRHGFVLLTALLFAGCSAIPEIAHQPQFHNPFPQLSRVAVLPFFNQSTDPTIDTDQVAIAYYNELQQIPGFEVMPVGVAKRYLLALGVGPGTKTDFSELSGQDIQELARQMNVDAIVLGSVTEFSPYYPPRMGLSIQWFAANDGFHPIPPGYGLPWGTSEEEFIPDSLVFEAEFALAKKQLATQTPTMVRESARGTSPVRHVADQTAQSAVASEDSSNVAMAEHRNLEVAPPLELELEQPGIPLGPSQSAMGEGTREFPLDWPDPRGFVPPPPNPERPGYLPQYRPVMTHTRLYQGDNEEFTTRLANYYYFRDDARFGGWQSYLQRSDDFIRFCCYLHITEMLAARGGASKTRVVWRWPISRYD